MVNKYELFFFLITEIVRKNCDPFNKGRRQILKKNGNDIQEGRNV